MGLRERFSAGLAKQLGHPSGMRGRLVARGLNKGNRNVVLAAVAASEVHRDQTVADLGFGGGVGLRLLLDGVGVGGRVHGVEISETMLDGARRRFAQEVEAGRLTLSAGDLGALPLPDASLDAAITTNTVYFVEDLPRAFAEVARVVRPGGRVVVGIGDPDNMRTMTFTAHGFRLRPVEEVAGLLEAAGFGAPADRRVGEGEGAFHLLVAQRVGVPPEGH
ncbi:class I SAM-dependent methyltransferase [Nocardioides sp.]|uniref:class I SAM-dependent methyltransferase n=1 Tax=Nocardioides sp. TaxID=35761 RepID=UPI002CF12C35|nr:methyltransferase domain-containing protein [Nocardioides sp.]HXH77483.1 methyltransferase domain-containing protein [Nocardioides sp.]